MNTLPATLKPKPRLAAFIKACEKWCVADCCGIDAFDFSPLHIASHMSAYSGEISEQDLLKIENEIDSVASQARAVPRNEQGYVCSIDGTNQYFTREELDALFNLWRTNLRLAVRVWEFAKELEAKQSD